MKRLALFALIVLGSAPCDCAIAAADTPLPAEPAAAQLAAPGAEVAPAVAIQQEKPDGIPDFLAPTPMACSQYYLCDDDYDCFAQCYAGCGLNGWCNTHACTCVCTDQF